MLRERYRHEDLVHDSFGITRYSNEKTNGEYRDEILENSGRGSANCGWPGEGFGKWVDWAVSFPQPEAGTITAALVSGTNRTVVDQPDIGAIPEATIGPAAGARAN